MGMKMVYESNELASSWTLLERARSLVDLMQGARNEFSTNIRQIEKNVPSYKYTDIGVIATRVMEFQNRKGIYII